jgi:hypothetical protein
MANIKAAGKCNSSPSRAGWHGAPRKSRQRRLPISGTLGAPLEWSPTADDWGRFESAYGATFDSVLRAEIERVVAQYLYDAPFEVAAPPAEDLMKSLAKATRLAKDLGKVVHSFGGGGAIVARHWKRYFPAEEEDRAREALADEDDTALFARIVDMPCKQGRNYRDFSQVVHTIFSALDASRREIARNGAAAFSEGDAWSQLIVDLACAFLSKDLGVSATKNADRQLSPFVRFVKELQATFEDENFRRHPTGPGLSRAISQVLRHISSTLFFLFFLPCYLASKYGGGDLAQLTPDQIPP